ncbi:MAG: penicillin-binding transpeptidase domain-containing protein [Bryobacteraceae bacterium]
MPSARTTATRRTSSTARIRTVSFTQTTEGRSAMLRSATFHATTRRRRAAYSPWTSPTYADSTIGDNVDGEDLVVRRAAVEALGPYNGSVVVSDPETGRILTIVNQKVAFAGGFEPCSTIKVPVALAALSEGLIERTTMVRLYGRTRMDLTEALAHSNNGFFASLGQKLGFDRVLYYAKLFGLGEKAGLGIEGEQPGALPDEPPKEGGVGMMTSFGLGFELTPLEYAGLLGSIANGGTLYYLQYPRSAADISNLVPRVKRHLDIAQWIPEIKPGMMGAVEYGTAHRAAYDPNEPIFGKTGTCTDSRSPTHLGWFGSFDEVGDRKLVVVVLLTGARGVSGPIASGVAGQVYKNLSHENFFQQARSTSPVALLSAN